MYNQLFNLIFIPCSDVEYIRNEIHLMKTFKHENIINHYDSFIGCVINPYLKFLIYKFGLEMKRPG